MYYLPVEGVIPALSANNNSLTTQLSVLSHNMYQQMEKADKYISAAQNHLHSLTVIRTFIIRIKGKSLCPILCHQFVL